MISSRQFCKVVLGCIYENYFVRKDEREGLGFVIKTDNRSKVAFIYSFYLNRKIPFDLDTTQKEIGLGLIDCL